MNYYTVGIIFYIDDQLKKIKTFFKVINKSRTSKYAQYIQYLSQMASQCQTLVLAAICFALSVLFIVLAQQVIDPIVKTQCYSCSPRYRYCGQTITHQQYCCKQDKSCQSDAKYCQYGDKLAYSCPPLWMILLKGLLSLSIIGSLVLCCSACFGEGFSNYKAPRSAQDPSVPEYQYLQRYGRLKNRS